LPNSNIVVLAIKFFKFDFNYLLKLIFCFFTNC